LRQNYGLGHTIDVLRGSASDKIKQLGHDRLSTYGIGKDKSAHYWKHLAWQLIHKEYCLQDSAQFNVIKLTSKAVPILKGQECIYLTIPVNELTGTKKKKKERSTVNDKSNPLFELLRSLRRKLAEEENKPPFMIFSDATLHDMVQIKPKTLEQMLDVSGVGQHKLAHYGQQFLTALTDYSEVE
jgi:ATP-dependent DNA helicase RecQ